MAAVPVDTRVLDASMDAVVVTDGEGHVLRWNAVAEAMFGWSAADAEGRELALLIVPENLREAHRRGLRALAAGERPRIPGGRTETVGQRADGTRFPVELTITRIEDDADPGAGGGVMFFGFLRDISERQQMLAELRESRERLLTVSDDARRRVERDLHDGAQQQLVALAISLAAARRKIEADPVAGGELVERSSALLADAIAELRELARGVHSAILTERGLGAAVTHVARRSPIEVETVIAPFGRLPSVVETSVYYLVTEALTNATKYGARHVLIELSIGSGRAGGSDLDLLVSDDGPGGADPASGTGLAGMTERLLVLGGTVEVDSPRGRGTKVRARVPLPAGAEVG